MAIDDISLIDANKFAVLALSLIGFLLDGPGLSDVLFIGAMVVWLWLPDFVHIEQRLINAARSWRTSTLKAREARSRPRGSMAQAIDR